MHKYGEILDETLPREIERQSAFRYGCKRGKFNYFLTILCCRAESSGGCGEEVFSSTEDRGSQCRQRSEYQTVGRGRR